MKVGDKVWHKEFHLRGIILAINPVTAFVLWNIGVGTEANRRALTVSGDV